MGDKIIKKGHFFSKKMSEGIYLISCLEWKTEKASVNSWLIVGEKKALLVDAGLKISGLKQYAEEIAEKEVGLFLTHGHFDHTGALHEFDKFYMHPADENLLKGGKGLPATDYNAELLPIYSGENIELGGRKLTAFQIKGHTQGSLVLYDEKSRFLFSGDSIARRIFFPEIAKLSMSQFFDDLLKVNELDYEFIASAHDGFLLKRKQVPYLIRTICDMCEQKGSEWSVGGCDYLAFHAGKDETYLSWSVPKEKIETVKTDIKRWKQRNKL